MQKLRASGAPWSRRAAVALVIAGLGMTAPDALAGPLGPVALAPGLGCGVHDGAQPATRTVLRPKLVRAERVKPLRPRRAVPAAPARAPAEDPPAVVQHAFYACAALPLPAITGWVAVGPLRRA